MNKSIGREGSQENRGENKSISRNKVTGDSLSLNKTNSQFTKIKVTSLKSQINKNSLQVPNLDSKRMTNLKSVNTLKTRNTGRIVSNHNTLNKSENSFRFTSITKSTINKDNYSIKHKKSIIQEDNLIETQKVNIVVNLLHDLNKSQDSKNQQENINQPSTILPNKSNVTKTTVLKSRNIKMIPSIKANNASSNVNKTLKSNFTSNKLSVNKYKSFGLNKSLEKQPTKTTTILKNKTFYCSFSEKKTSQSQNKGKSLVLKDIKHPTSISKDKKPFIKVNLKKDLKSVNIKKVESTTNKKILSYSDIRKLNFGSKS